MQGHRNLITFHVPGTLTANLSLKWTASFDGRVKEISAVASNDSDATMTFGTSADADYTLAACTIGDSGTPVTKTVSNWATTNPTGVFSVDDVLAFALDYDGAAGTAADDFTLVITLLEG
jgi:hypothetical protein